MSSRSATIAVYAVLLGGLLLATAVARRRPDLLAGVPDVVRSAARTRAGQLVLLLVWWWLGWHFLLAA
ncbi:DUF6186 family protein [Pedococcus sp. NPDC057267]|uniref:DUF6186 family protein n=1 Tax=Pedococcus sp. NPDC057267 TaxID=3346077 RepID=UPI0036364C4F